jgi:phage portal protein BeeE
MLFHPTFYIHGMENSFTKEEIPSAPIFCIHMMVNICTKEEILLGFGVPESVLSNASGRSFDNAEQERLIFWQETMRPHLEFIAAPLDVLDENENLFVAFDMSSVDVLQRAEIKRREFLLREFDSSMWI